MSSKKAKKYESSKKEQKKVKKDDKKGKKKQKIDDNEESLTQLYALVTVLLCGLAGVSIYLLTPPKMSPHHSCIKGFDSSIDPYHFFKMALIHHL